jgi:hypothetical protein
MPGVVEALPLPIGEITSIDLEIAHTTLGVNLDSVTFSYEGTTTAILCRCVVESECVEIGFQIRDCGCIVPLIFRKELFNPEPEFAWSIR